MFKILEYHGLTQWVDTVKTLVKWVLLGTFIGLLVGVVGATFGHTLAFVNAFRAAHRWMILALPVAGLAIVFLYHFFKNTDDRGTNMVIASIHSSTDIPFKMAPLIFVSTVLTHLCGGSAGREGAAIQLGGSISNKIGKLLKLDENGRRTMVMCGMSAGFSALFGTPLAAAVFAMEVVSVGIMHYSALVPCVTASMIAHFVADGMHVPPEVFPMTVVPDMTPVVFFQIVLFGALVGVVSILFCLILHQAEHWYKRCFKNPYVRIFTAGCLVVLLAAVLRTDLYLGSGMGIIEHIFHTGEVPTCAFLLKMVFTALTLGAGFKGGEIVPSFCIGAAFGCAASGVLGLTPAMAAACGMVGVFCGVTNSPLTALLISFELFGYAGMPYFLTTIAVSYLLSGNYGLYHAQKIMYSKTETKFVNVTTH